MRTFFLISLGHIRAVLKRINEIQSRIERFNICCYNGAEQRSGDGLLSVTAPHGTAEQLSTQVATWQIRCEDSGVEVTQERHQDCGCSGWLCQLFDTLGLFSAKCSRTLRRISRALQTGGTLIIDLCAKKVICAWQL